MKNGPNFLIYTPSSEKSKKHLAVCYLIETDLDNKKFSLTSDEHIKKSGHSKSGHIYDIDNLIENEEEFEEWSMEILKNAFRIKTRKKQITLFDDFIL